MKAILLVAIVGSIGGCATIGSEVVSVGKDTYQRSMTGVGFATQANTNIKALKAANSTAKRRASTWSSSIQRSPVCMASRRVRTSWYSSACTTATGSDT